MKPQAMLFYSMKFTSNTIIILLSQRHNTQLRITSPCLSMEKVVWPEEMWFVFKCIISLFIDVIFCAEKETKNRLCSTKNSLSKANCITEMFLRYLQFHCLWVHIQNQLHGLWIHMTKFHGLRVYGPRSMGPCHCDLVPQSMCPWPSSMVPCNPVLWSMGPHDPVPWSRVHMTHNVLQRQNSTTCKGITIVDHTISRHQLKSVHIIVIVLFFSEAADTELINISRTELKQQQNSTTITSSSLGIHKHKATTIGLHVLFSLIVHPLTK